jgi:hypothetical protein
MNKGILGNFKLKIPWTSFQSSPFIIEISNVFLVIKPKVEEEVIFQKF